MRCTLSQLCELSRYLLFLKTEWPSKRYAQYKHIETRNLWTVIANFINFWLNKTINDSDYGLYDIFIDQIFELR